jgi:hypothetical protein
MRENFPAHVSAESPSNISPKYIELISKFSKISKISKILLTYENPFWGLE